MDVEISAIDPCPRDDVKSYGCVPETCPTKAMTNGTGTDSTQGGRPSRSKVQRVIDELDLTGLGDELERLWQGTGDERRSLRQLEAAFNVRVLEASIERAEGRLLDGEAENLYRLLTGDDVATSARTEAEARLERIGTDVEQLRDRFVSHQAIHTYLRSVREASAPEPSADETVERRRQSIQRLRNRLAAVTEQGIEGLVDAGHLSVGDFDAVVGVSIHCRDCGGTYDVSDLLDRGGCACDRPADP